MTHQGFVSFLRDEVGFNPVDAAHYAGRLPRTNDDRRRLAASIRRDIAERRSNHERSRLDLARHEALPFEKRMSADWEKLAEVTVGGEVPGGYLDNLGFWEDSNGGPLPGYEDDHADDTHGYVNPTDAIDE